MAILNDCFNDVFEIAIFEKFFLKCITVLILSKIKVKIYALLKIVREKSDKRIHLFIIKVRVKKLKHGKYTVNNVY